MKFIYLVVPSIVVELLFRYILRIMRHFCFKYGSIGLRNQNNQPVIYQHLDIVLLIIGQSRYSYIIVISIVIYAS